MGVIPEAAGSGAVAKEVVEGWQRSWFERALLGSCALSVMDFL